MRHWRIDGLNEGAGKIGQRGFGRWAPPVPPLRRDGWSRIFSTSAFCLTLSFSSRKSAPLRSVH